MVVSRKKTYYPSYAFSNSKNPKISLKFYYIFKKIVSQYTNQVFVAQKQKNIMQRRSATYIPSLQTHNPYMLTCSLLNSQTILRFLSALSNIQMQQYPKGKKPIGGLHNDEIQTYCLNIGSYTCTCCSPYGLHIT